MELTLQNCCLNCGGTLKRISETQWECMFCRSIHNDATVEKHVEELKDVINSAKLERLSNLRRNLYSALNAENISSKEIKNVCASIKEMLPDDFQANFYHDACSLSGRELADRIGDIDVEENIDVIEQVVKFLLRSAQEEYLLDLADLIEKAFKATNRLDKYAEYSSWFSDEAEKVQGGIYETSLPRDAFIAYSSKDMEVVKKLVKELEDSGISCFVAAQNLRHGKGSVENYNKALCEAMDNCRSFVFVSSKSSRSFTCDAFRIEIPYIMSKDIANAPGNLRNNYCAIPQQYKKCRVEYRIEESSGKNPADRKIDEFFDGYERVYTSDEVAMRVGEHIMCVPELEVASASSSTVTETKICVACGSQVPANAKFCGECGKSEFVNTVVELVQLNNRKMAEDRHERDKSEITIEHTSKQESSQTGNTCKVCGGTIERADDGHNRCSFCGTRYSINTDNTSPLKLCSVCGGAVKPLMDGYCHCDYCNSVYSYNESDGIGAPMPLDGIYTIAMDYYYGKNDEQDYEKAISFLTVAAERSNANAQFALACCYDNGEGTDPDPDTAFKWYQKAAEQGHAGAQFNLALCYDYGQGTERDIAKAIKWYRTAAERGDADAQLNLGMCYDNGDGVEQNYHEAVKWYQLSADQGNSDAQYNLALCYKNGQGVDENPKEAFKWFNASAEQGDAEAQFQLANYYFNGQVVETDLEKAMGWYKRSAEQDNANAQCCLGFCYTNQGRHDEAVKWYEKSASHGNTSAQFNLGKCYHDGNGVARDMTKAVEWYKRAAAQGHRNAQIMLSKLCIQ